MNTIDFHMHSTASDGSDSIPQLLENLKKSGIRTFSVTDHDTISGTLEMQKLVPKEMQFVPGVEFSCITDRGKCHILGYRFDPRAPAMVSALEHGRRLRRVKLDTRLDYLDRQWNIRLTGEETDWLLSHSSPGKPHLAKILVDRGLFPDISGAIRTVLDPCRTPNTRIPGEEAVSAILASGGIPVWAHPLGGEGEPRISEAAFHSQLVCLMGSGLRGLECFYSRYSREEIAFLRDHARKNGLLVSAGSDYHGTNKVNISLGKLNAACEDVPEAEITLKACLF